MWRIRPLRMECSRKRLERFTALVGDGCLIRMADSSGALAARAADHRDDDRRQALLALIDAPPLPPGGWLGQALERGRPVPLPTFDRPALIAAGLPADERLGDAIAFPVLDDVLAVLIRDRIAGPYGGRERARCEQLAADLRLALGAPADEPLSVSESLPAPGTRRRAAARGGVRIRCATGSSRSPPPGCGWSIPTGGPSTSTRPRASWSAGRAASLSASRSASSSAARRRSDASRRRGDDRRPPAASGRRQHVLARGDDPPAARRPR